MHGSSYLTKWSPRLQSALEVGPGVAAKERELGWTDSLVRIADRAAAAAGGHLRACGISFSPAKKDDAEAALNYLRRCCSERRLAVHPRCKTTIAHLQGGIWNNARSIRAVRRTRPFRRD